MISGDNFRDDGREKQRSIFCLEPGKRTNHAVRETSEKEVLIEQIEKLNCGFPWRKYVEVVGGVPACSCLGSVACTLKK